MPSWWSLIRESVERIRRGIRRRVVDYLGTVEPTPPEEILGKTPELFYRDMLSSRETEREFAFTKWVFRWQPGSPYGRTVPPGQFAVVRCVAVLPDGRTYEVETYLSAGTRITRTEIQRKLTAALAYKMGYKDVDYRRGMSDLFQAAFKAIDFAYVTSVPLVQP